MNTKDGRIAPERDAIILRALGPGYGGKQKQADLERLGTMLGDRSLASALIEQLEKQGAASGR